MPRNIRQRRSAAAAAVSSPLLASADPAADFLVVDCRERGEILTVGKLHLLLYYAQAWHLALQDVPIFGEDFSAGWCGPRLPSQLLRFGSRNQEPILAGLCRPQGLAPLLQRHLVQIVRDFGSEHAHALQCMVCAEDPWMRARAGTQPHHHSDASVSKTAMRAYCSYLQAVAA